MLSKPPKVQLKKHLINYVIEETSLPESVVSSVINWVTEDTQKYGLKKDSVELSGFGKFVVYPKKLEKKRNILKKMIEKNCSKFIERAVENLKILEIYGNQGERNP